MMISKATKLHFIEEDMIMFMDDAEKTAELIKEYNKVVESSEFEKFEL